ncbi:MAG: DUF3263 domain-containing protein [Actinomycetes bacterium]|jgi:hypothetical protein
MLSPEARAILDFERGWWRLDGAKDRLIESVLGLPAADYYERLLELLDDPDAEAYDPLTLRRVRSMIETPVTEEVMAL